MPTFEKIDLKFKIYRNTFQIKKFPKPITQKNGPEPKNGSEPINQQNL